MMPLCPQLTFPGEWGLVVLAVVWGCTTAHQSVHEASLSPVFSLGKIKKGAVDQSSGCTCT